MERFKLSDRQAQAILDLRLARLTHLEVYKLEQELKELKELIEKLTKILNSPKLQLETVKSELLEIKKRFKVERASIIIKDLGEFVIPTEDDSKPIEEVVVDVPEDCAGSIINSLSTRKGELADLKTRNGRAKLTFIMPARGLFGYKSQFMTETRGEGIMSSTFKEYQPYKGTITRRNVGALVAFEEGEAVQYGLYNIQERGKLIVVPGDKVYGGMVVGFNPKGDDIVVNVCKKKHLTNTRSSSSDETLRLEPVKKPTLEEFLEYLDEDELLEVTPLSLRMRKTILDHTQRGRMDFKRKQQEQ